MQKEIKGTCMPTLPKAKVERLKDTKKGSLLSIRAASGHLMFGFRISVPGERGDPEEPAFLHLRPRYNGGFEAHLVPTFAQFGWVINGNMYVVNHTDSWSIHVCARDWDAEHKLRNFGSDDSGLLLLDEDGTVALAVSEAGSCRYLNLSTWLAVPPNANSYIAARRWNLSLPGIGTAAEWPFGETPSTADELASP